MENIIVRNLEITSVCNYKCPICVSRKRGTHMDMNEFYKIVDNNFQHFDVDGVWLHFCGEPLTNPKLVDYINYICLKGVKTRLSTNGLLLDDKRREIIANSGLNYLVVSISTLDRETYKKIRGCDRLPQVLDNLFKFKKYVDDNNIQMEIQAVMIDTESGRGKEEFIKFFHSYGIHAAFHNFTNRADNVSLDLFDANNHDYSLKRGLCIDLEKRIIILSNGDIIACPCDFEAKNSLGNLKDYDYSLEKLLKNGKLDEIKENLKKNKYVGACEKCSDWIYYQENSQEEYVYIYPANK